MYMLISDRKKLKRSSQIRLRSYYRDDLAITTIVAGWLLVKDLPLSSNRWW